MDHSAMFKVLKHIKKKLQKKVSKLWIGCVCIMSALMCVKLPDCYIVALQ